MTDEFMEMALRTQLADAREAIERRDDAVSYLRAELAVLTVIPLPEWWSPTRIASLLGEDITPEEVGMAISRVPELRERRDLPGLCRAVPYNYRPRAGARLREGTRYEYSLEALRMVAPYLAELVGVRHG